MHASPTQVIVNGSGGRVRPYSTSPFRLTHLPNRPHVLLVFGGVDLPASARASCVSCVGCVYVCALSRRCCLFLFLRVLALVSPLFQVFFILQTGKPSLRVLQSMGQGEYHHHRMEVCWSLCRGSSPAVKWSRGTVRQATLGSSKCCKYIAW